MADNTILIATPECGRNLNPNGILDQENDFKSFDHSDANSRRVFTLMAGPGVDADRVIGDENNPVGLTSDGVATIAEILGVKQEVVNSGYLEGGTMSLFDRM